MANSGELCDSGPEGGWISRFSSVESGAEEEADDRGVATSRDGGMREDYIDSDEDCMSAEVGVLD